MKQLQFNGTRKYRRWTEAEESYLKENYPNDNNKELALHFERTEGAIKSKAKELGLKKEITPVWTEGGIGCLRENFGKLSYSELSKRSGHSEAEINEKIRELFPPADRPKIFYELLKEQVAEFTIDREKEDTIQQIKKWALDIGRGFIQHDRFKYLRLQSYRLMIKAVIAEAYEWEKKKEEIPFEKEWETIRGKRYALRRIIYKYYDE